MARSNNANQQGKIPLFFFVSLLFFTKYLPDMGCSDHTLRSYKKSLRLLLDFAESRGFKVTTFRFSDCNRDFLFDFLEWLRDVKENAASTICNRLAAVKSYAKYAEKQDTALESCIIEIDSVSWKDDPDEIGPTIKQEQFELIIDQIPDTPKGFRNRVMLLVLYETAIRVSELLNITVDDLYLDGNSPYIKIKGKGKKDRPVPLTVDLAVCLKQYLSEMHDVECPGFKGVFYSICKGKPGVLDQRTVRYILQGYADEARLKDPSIPEHVGCHCLRRSRGTTLYHNGMEFESVSSLLGHEHLETTRAHYAQPSLEMMREAMEKSSPAVDTEEPNWLGKEDELAKLFGL